MEFSTRYAVVEGTSRLLAYPDSNLSVREFVDGAWVPFKGVFETWLDSKPITEEEAMLRTSGVKPL